jgi:hypothetical protein
VNVTHVTLIWAVRVAPYLIMVTLTTLTRLSRHKSAVTRSSITTLTDSHSQTPTGLSLSHTYNEVMCESDRESESGCGRVHSE